MNNFTGKNILITGGSSGIGLAIASVFAKRGANVWLLARDQAKLNNACRQVSALASTPDQQFGLIQADVSNSENISAAIQEYLLHFGAPDILVNSAGITYPGLFHEMELAHHRDNMEINYFGTLHTTLAVVPKMIERQSGHIVNMSSLVGIHGLYGYSAYSPSKFAIRGLSDSLRYELKPFGISVSVAFPSDTITPQLEFENEFKPPVLKALSEGNTKAVSADIVAANIIRDLEKGRYLIFPSSDAWLWFLAYSILPGESLYRVVDLMMNRARRKVAKDLASQKHKT